jgi:hypothetical protein
MTNVFLTFCFLSFCFTAAMFVLTIFHAWSSSTKKRKLYGGSHGNCCGIIQMVASKVMKSTQENPNSSQLILKKWKGRFLRKFDRTPIPEKETDVVCPHFMMLACANGCPHNCAWCYIKDTFRFYRQKLDGGVPIVYKDRTRLEKEIQSFLRRKPLVPELINTGEPSDSLIDEAGRIVSAVG